MFEHIDRQFLGGATVDFYDPTCRDLVARWEPHREWLNGRLQHGIEPYSKFTPARISPATTAGQRDGRVYAGVNFASQDYLNLASHRSVHDAARRAIALYGVHSAGSAALMGNTRLSLELEERLADFLGYRDCTVFPTGWGAGYGVIKTLVTASDHVIIDVLAHACLQEGARNATANIHTFPHLSTEAVRRRLERIRQDDPNAGILVVTETVFSMDSDTPQLNDLHALCRKYDAVLLVDVAHDLGALGATGRGELESQGMTGKPDVLMGSFSKTFASNGGFIACNNPALKLALRYNCGPLTFTNALSPVQCAIVLKSLEIVDSDEGAELRMRLMTNVLRLREAMKSAEFRLLGRPSPIVPAILGDNARSRLRTRYTLEGGGIVNLVEYPAVSRNTCRWRLQVMALHDSEQIEKFVDIAVAARAKTEAHISEFHNFEDGARLDLRCDDSAGDLVLIQKTP